jgi:hypothetical protein
MPQVTKDQLKQRLAKVAEFYKRAVPVSTIAKRVGVTERQVYNDLNAIRKDWKQSSISDFDERLAVELAKIDNLEKTYWEAWERSCKVEKKKTEKEKGNVVEGEFKVSEKEIMKMKVSSVGNAKFLDGVYKCIDKRCDLLGLNSPTKIEHSLGFEESKVSDLPEHLKLSILEHLNKPGEAASDR